MGEVVRTLNISLSFHRFVANKFTLDLYKELEFVDIYNLRIEYQSSVPYRTIPEAEEEEDDDKIVILGIEQYSIFSYY